MAAAAAKSLQLCLTLCDLIDSSPPGSSVHGIFQAKALEWDAIAFSIKNGYRVEMTIGLLRLFKEQSMNF